MRKKNLAFRGASLHLIGAICLLASLCINQGCAVIAGGSKYYGHFVVEGHPNAAIKYDGITRGYGSATIKLPRNEANNLMITVSESGCPTIQRQYTERKFRGWSFVGTLVTWTGLSINGGPWVPIPFGVIVDGSTGAWWKPDVNENGITKTDYKNYNYSIIYNECNKTQPDEKLEDTSTRSEAVNN